MSDTVAKPTFYRPLSAIAAALVLFVGAQILAALLLSIVPLLLGWGETKTTVWLENSAWAQFLFVIIVETITIYLLWQLMKRRAISFLHLGWNNPRLRYVVYALVGFASYFVLYILTVSIIKTLVPALDLEQQQEIGFDKAATGLELAPIFISLVVLPPLVEEIVARGFLYTNLRAYTTAVTAAIITSILFAVAHLGGAVEGLLWVAAIDTFVLSMVMCYLREKTGSLWPPIGVHFIKNGLAFFFLFNIGAYFG